MSGYRVVPIFDPRAEPQCWSMRMKPGEFAVILADARHGGPADESGHPVAEVNQAPA